MSAYEQIHDPGRPDMIRADHPRQVLVTCGDHGVIRITITDHEGLTHVFTHGGGPLYYIETREEESEWQESMRGSASPSGRTRTSAA